MASASCIIKLNRRFRRRECMKALAEFSGIKSGSVLIRSMISLPTSSAFDQLNSSSAPSNLDYTGQHHPKASLTSLSTRLHRSSANERAQLFHLRIINLGYFVSTAATANPRASAAFANAAVSSSSPLAAPSQTMTANMDWAFFSL